MQQINMKKTLIIIIQPANIPTWNINTLGKGETSNLCTKLTEALVLQIYRENNSHNRIAKDYKISRPMVTMIKNGQRWKWLTEQYKTNLKPAI